MKSVSTDEIVFVVIMSAAVVVFLPYFIDAIAMALLSV